LNFYHKGFSLFLYICKRDSGASSPAGSPYPFSSSTAGVSSTS